MTGITDKDTKNLQGLINWFFTKNNNQSLCIAIYRNNYGEELKYAINSLHGKETSKITSKESVGDNLEDTIKDYVKQV